MKKQALFLLAGGLLTFAACTNEQAAPAGGYTQEQVDSAVEARLAEMQAQMQASNDSAINVLAQWKADSMIAAAKGQKPATTKPKVKAPSAPTTTPVTTTPTTPKAPDRPGATNNGVKTTSDREGATNSNEPKKVNERPGATNNK